eukprot:5476987-Pyramimonas_sp.AAC.1
MNQVMQVQLNQDKVLNDITAAIRDTAVGLYSGASGGAPTTATPPVVTAALAPTSPAEATA